MTRTLARITGIAMALVGVALAVYSFPFATWVAFSFFLLGLAGIGVGIWLFAFRSKVMP